MKKILFITSQYRVGERIYPIIPELAKQYELHLLKTYQMQDSFKWTGDNDLRKVFDTQYSKYFTETYSGFCDSSKYDLIISDDNRATPKTSLDSIYKNKRCPLIACSHGNEEKKFTVNAYKKAYDYCFVFGSKEHHEDWCIGAGIPSNDMLKQYQHVNKKHILVIVNFLGNRSAPFDVKFDGHIFNHESLKKLQEKYKLPVAIKLKSRADEQYANNIQYLIKIIKDLNYKIFIDVEDDNQLIAESVCVISAPSTFALKPIQMGVPTILIKNSGQTGVFYDYDGMFDLNDDFLPYIENYQRKTKFIEQTIAGGVDYTSTQTMVTQIQQILN